MHSGDRTEAAVLHPLLSFAPWGPAQCLCFRSHPGCCSGERRSSPEPQALSSSTQKGNEAVARGSLSPSPGNSLCSPEGTRNISEPRLHSPATCCNVDSWNLGLGSTKVVGQLDDGGQVISPL